MPAPSRRYRDFPGVTFRPMDSFDDFGKCVALQRETWGHDWTDVIPPSMLKVSQKVGGILAGAFDGERLLGFVFGLTGIRDGRPAHWSHQLAVTAGQQNSGLGRQLKLYQRDLLLSAGVRVMYWTYDPLVARNAHLNLNRLGARIHEYVPDFYKGETSSELHSGVGTDRFVVRWTLNDARTKRALAGKAVTDYAKYAESPVVNQTDRRTDGWAVEGNERANLGTSERGEGPVELPLPNVPRLRIQVPAEILEIQRTDNPLAWKWRLTTRRAFMHYLSKGWQVDGIYRDTDALSSFYVLARGMK